jgi:hypothetical protein
MIKFATVVVVLCLSAGMVTMVAGCAPEFVDDTTSTDRTSPGEPTPLNKPASPASTSTPTAEQATALEAGDKLAELHVVGGIAGLCDHLVVYADGSGSYFNECSGEQTDFQVESEPFEQLMGMAAQFGPFFHSEEDNPDGPDNMLTELALYGQGASTDQPNQEQRDVLLILLLAILNQGIS